MGGNVESRLMLYGEIEEGGSMSQLVNSGAKIPPRSLKSHTTQTAIDHASTSRRSHRPERAFPSCLDTHNWGYSCTP